MFFLSKHIFLCRSDDCVILLDLKRNKYLSLSRDDAFALSGLVHGWPVSTNQIHPSVSEADASSIARELLKQKILTTDAAKGKEATVTRSVTPTKSLVDDPGFPCEPRSYWRLPFVISASMAAKYHLAARSLEWIVCRVKHRRLARNAGHPRADDVRTRELVALFSYVRPLLFTAKNACLLESLALINFLASAGVFPNWVFAVQPEPFAAHCWVQVGQTVLNDPLDCVKDLVPIMVV